MKLVSSLSLVGSFLVAASLAPARRKRVEHLISEGLVRLSVGLEDIADLLDDLEQQLAAA